MKEFILKQKTPTCFELHRFIIREYIKQVSYNTNIICFYNVSIIIQQDATIYNLFISAKCSTCFGWYLHPPSGSHIAVSTVSGITETDTVDTVIWDPDGGWRYHPKHVEHFADINKLYIVASCWIIIDTYYAMHGQLNIKFVSTTINFNCI